jgi:hypothetical protein
LDLGRDRQAGPRHVHLPDWTPAIASWQWRDAAAEAAASYDDSTWASSAQPQPFGASNFQNGYGWYRAKFTAASAGSITANIGGGVRASAMAFANGKQVTVSNGSFSVSSVAGENTVAILAKHEGLDKMYNVTGATGTGQYAGIWGNVTNGSAALASTWKFRGGLGGMDETSVVGLVKNWSTFLGGTWADTQATKSWPAFWKGTFKSPLQAGVFATVGLRTSGLSSGSVWLNGHNVGRFSGNTLLYLPEGWLAADNTVVIYDASGSSPTGAKLEYFETRARYPYGSGSAGTGGSSGAGGNTGRGGATSGGGATGRGGATGTAGNTGRGGTGGVGTAGSGGSIGGATGSGASGGKGGAAGKSGATGGGGASNPGGGGAGGSTAMGDGGHTGTSGTGGTSGEPPTGQGSNSGGCNCGMAGNRSEASVLATTVLVMLGMAWRRRRSGQGNEGPEGSRVGFTSRVSGKAIASVRRRSCRHS